MNDETSPPNCWTCPPSLLWGVLAAAACLILPVPAPSAEPPWRSPDRCELSLLEVVRRYADAMIAHGRDTYGLQRSGLLLSALDRRTLKPLDLRPEPPGGVRRGDRVGLPWRRLTGANPHHDQNLLRLLYVLSEIEGEGRYREVADHEIQWFFRNTQSPATGLLPWGEHLSWDEQVKKKPFRDLVIRVADAYGDALPDEDVDVWPMSLAHIISAQVAAYRFTHRNGYLNEARRFAQMAVGIFFQDSPLPRASFKTDHYESTTGSDTLALALAELHLSTRTITIVRTPANTIDR